MSKVLFPDYFPNRCPPYDDHPRYWNTDLAGFMRIYWRVKTWQVRVTNYNPGFLNPEGDYIPESTETAILKYERVDYQYALLTSEEQLVCGLNFLEPREITGVDHMDYYQFGFDPSFNNYNSYSLDSRAAFRIGTGNQKDTQIGVYPTGDPNYNPAAYTVTIENFGSNSATATFFQHIPEYYELLTTARIIALEYWSYGGTYDTATGEPL